MDEAHDCGFLRIADQPLVDEVVTVGRCPAYPPPCSAQSVRLVPDAVSQHLPLELCEREQNAQHQSAEAVLRVERLGHANESDFVLFEQIDEPDEVGQRTGEPVELVDYDHVYEPLLHGAQKTRQVRPVEVAAGVAAVVVALRKLGPVSVALRADVGRADVTLHLEAVELQIESVAHALSGVDRAPDWSPRRRTGCTLHLLPL